MKQANAVSAPVLIMAGGTGGHVFPALAVANELLDEGMTVVWMGTRTGLEARVIPKLGFQMEWVHVSGIRGKGLLSMMWAPIMLLFAFMQAFVILLRVRPCVVLGMGGYLSGPGGLVAWMMRYPLVIHEQNSVAGLTNRLLAPLAVCVMEAFPGSLNQKYEPVHTGNPVRKTIAQISEPARRLQQRTGPIQLLILGGSLGAQVLNEVIPAALAQIESGLRPEVRHQAGRGLFEAAQASYRDANIHAQVVPFIESMEEAYQWADLVVCRAGAMTIAELAAAGVASILVPYPHAVDDHQTVNARFLVDAEAAVLMPQTELTPEHLASVLTKFSSTRDGLVQMSVNARHVAKPEATRHITECCLRIAASKAQGKSIQ